MSRKHPKHARPRPTAGPQLTLTIEAVAFGGDGLARQEGKVFFVPDTLPEQIVQVEVLKDHGRFAHARRLHTQQPASYQTPSACAFSDRCGGCQWLEVPYERQIAWKKSFIAAAFQKFAQVELPQDWPFLSAPEKFAYRNRIKLKFQHKSDGSFTWGYYAKGSHDLVPISYCAIANSSINKILEALSVIRVPAPKQGALYELELQHLPGSQDKVTACFLPAAPDSFMDQLAQASQSHPVLSQKLIWSKSSDPSRCFEVDRDLTYVTHAGQFQQINREANHYLRLWVERQALALEAHKVVDLFCGSGNLSLGLVSQGCQVWGLEVGETAIAAAQVNLAVNELSGARYGCGMAHEMFEIFPELNSTLIDLLIVDPPRKGMAEAIPAILRLEPKHLIYVSCDPNTLARDIKSLVAAGYQLEEVMGLDFFPHSYHVETVARLSLSNKERWT
jgi:23S rRNA (uracil1939-C5)-methyltransferase